MPWLQGTAARFHLPRRTLRMRLTLLYGALFLASGIVLLAFTNVLVRSGSTSVAQVNLSGPVPGPALAHAARIASQQHGSDVHQLDIYSLLALAIMAVLAIGLGWLVAGRVLRPLRIITATARDISASNLHERLNLGGPDDEFKELGQALDNLFARLEASFESQRHFVANASHELRTPLTAERALLQVTLTDPDATVDTWRSTSEELLTLGSQQERLIDSLLTLADSERGIERWERFDLAAVVDRVIAARGAEAERRGLHVDAGLTPAPAAGDPSLVESLVANLVDNALRHNLPGGRLEISTTTTAGRAILSVANTGALIPPDQVDRLFRPFQRLGDERVGHRDGHGLGLAIVDAIARAHGARVTARARTDGGLDVEVSFPPPDTDAPAHAYRPGR
jgi:signal transduction histidine kinase